MIDLHTHSTHSDGTHTPEELLEQAKQKKLKYYAITDHDEIEGSKKLVSLKPKDITIYSGIELNAKVDKGQMHILGYNIDLDNEELNKKIFELRSNSKNNIMLYIKQLKDDYGITLPQEDIDYLLNRDANVGRPMLARILIRLGHCSSVKEAFDKYLMDDKVRHIKLSVSKEECINLINNAGGIAVLAHPFTLKMTNGELEEEIRYLISLGLQGIEVIHPKGTPENREFYRYLARKYNLITTGGTDYHGYEVKPDIELGTGINDNSIVQEEDITILKKILTRY